MEVEGFAFLFFLWNQVKPFLDEGKFKVRLDKIGHATVTWDDKFIVEMLNRRMRFYSKARFDFAGLCDPSVDVSATLAEIVSTSTRSPRELIRLMDVILREHDIVHASKDEAVLLNRESFDLGQDVYVRDVINSVYGEKILGQIYRLKRDAFTNKDVQATFKVNDQSARARIQAWEDAGIVKQTGTRAAEGGRVGRPVYEYSVIDARVKRIITRQLIKQETSELPFDDNVE
jgi:predicted transcriptional regulator